MENNQINTTLKEQVMQQLKDGVKNLLDSDNFANWCKTQSRLYYNNYSFNNAMLTLLQNPNASYVCGYETWKSFGRQVKQGAKGIRVFSPVFIKEYGEKGSLFSTISKSCNEQLKKDSSLEYANYRLWQSKLSFNMYRNGLFDIKVNDEVKTPHVTSDEVRRFLDRSVIGKVPAYYDVVNVFDINDVTDNVEFLWVNKNACNKNEMVLDDAGNPVVNKSGQVKIYNSDERKSSFNKELDMTIHEQDENKMSLLYSTLKKVSEKKGIPFIEVRREEDKILSNGADAYYHLPVENYPNGYILMCNELPLTKKVSVSFHEMAHSDMHRDLNKTKEEMGGEIDVITEQMEEVQAESVAYMTASAFGIETEHSSFGYIAQWGDGRELKLLEDSLNIIYKESNKLLNEIEKELDSNGYTMSFEPKYKEISVEEKNNIITTHKEFILNNQRQNDIILKSLLEDLKENSNEQQVNIIKEQIVNARSIDNNLTFLDSIIENYFVGNGKNNYSVRQVHEAKHSLESVTKSIKELQEKVENLSLERIEVVNESQKKYKEDMKQLFSVSPLQVMEHLKSDFPELLKLNNNDLKFITCSKYISRTYGKYIGADNAKFVNNALNHLNDFKKAVSKNGVAIEINSCEQWSDKPIFTPGTLIHPKMANKMFSDAEQQIRAFKEQAEKQGEYYPYTRCEISVYALDSTKDKLTILNTRIDIGDNDQKDLNDHLGQICNKGERKVLLESFQKSIKERPSLESSIITPNESLNITSKETTHDMNTWKNGINGLNEPEEQDKDIKDSELSQGKGHLEKNTYEKE